MEARIFKSESSQGEEVVLRFDRPSQRVIGKGDFVYRENFSKAVRAGFMTNAEAQKLLVDRELWTEKEEEELKDVSAQILMLEGEIEDADRDKGTEIFGRLKRLRDKKSLISSVRSNILNNTAEQAASEMRTQFYASECVHDNKTGKRVFKNLEDFLSRLDEKIAIDSYRQALIVNWEYTFGISVEDNFGSTLPEDEWAAKMQEEEAKQQEEAPPQKKKRRGRKKKTQSS